MRILHSVHDYLPEKVAGVEVYTSRLLAGQRREDDVGLISARLDSNRRTGELVDSRIDGIRIFDVIQNRDWWRFEQTWLDRRLERAFRSTFERFEPDVLHVQHLMNLTLSLVDVAEEKQIPIVMTLHDHWWACANGGQRFHPNRTRCDRLEATKCGTCTWSKVGPALAARAVIDAGRKMRSNNVPEPRGVDQDHRVPGGSFRALRTGLALHCPTPFGARRIERRWQAMRDLSNRVEYFLVPSRDLAQAAIEFGFPADRVRILPHGIPSPERAASRPIRRLAKHFGYLGSIVPHKGVHHLIAAFDSTPPDARLSIYGSLADDPAYVEELRANIRHPGIHFLGPLKPESVPEALADLDCLIAPSIWRENAPLSIQEALAAGTPVIATDLGGHRELLENGGGLLVPPGDEDALGAAILRLTTEYDLNTRLARSVPAVRGIEEHISDLRGIYQSVIAAGAHTRPVLDAL